MPKINVDEFVKKLLEHSDKYPELKVYADGVKAMYELEKESEKSKKQLTKKEPKDTIPKVDVPIKVSEKDILASLGVGE